MRNSSPEDDSPLISPKFRPHIIKAEDNQPSVIEPRVSLHSPLDREQQFTAKPEVPLQPPLVDVPVAAPDQKGVIEVPSLSKPQGILFHSSPLVGPVNRAEELQGGRPSDPKIAYKRDFVRNMTLHAWRSYRKYAWGANELKPISKQPHLPGVFGKEHIGLTIVDSLDTLFIMGLDEEVEAGRQFIEKLDLNEAPSLSVFETTIRFLAGFLTMYSFTGDKLYLDKAIQVADALLPAFETPTGIPKTFVSFKTHETKQLNWVTNKCSILSEVGTIQMEFTLLSELTGNPIYATKVARTRDALQKAAGAEKMYYVYISPETGKFCSSAATMSGLGDSFYEYLLKEWVRTNGKDSTARTMYDEAIEALKAKGMFQQSKRSKFDYIAELSSGGNVKHDMGHLACFAGGMFALGAVTQMAASSSSSADQSSYLRDPWFKLGAGVTETCRASYEKSATHLGPEAFTFNSDIEAQSVRSSQKAYLLRPETIESYFILWRLTKDTKYRDWAWDAAKAIEKHTRVEAGYSGIRDVYSAVPVHDDVQQSFFLAETLKYLYLIFSDDSVIPLDRWVFNTEAHPFPITGRVMLSGHS